MDPASVETKNPDATHHRHDEGPNHPELLLTKPSRVESRDEPRVESRDGLVLDDAVQDLKFAKMVQTAKASCRLSDDLDPGVDENDVEVLPVKTLTCIQRILAYLLAVDNLVYDAYLAEVVTEELLQAKSARLLSQFHATHAADNVKTHSLMFEAYTPTKEALIKTIASQVDAVKTWIQQRTDPATTTFAERLIAFVALDGIFSAGPTCIWAWAKSREMLHCLQFAEKIVQRDRNFRCDFVCTLYLTLKNKIPEANIQAIVQSAVKQAQALIIELLGASTIPDLQPKHALQYIEFVADRILSALGVDNMYHVENPFQELFVSSNFFECRETEYARRASVTVSAVNQEF